MTFSMVVRPLVSTLMNLNHNRELLPAPGPTAGKRNFEPRNAYCLPPSRKIQLAHLQALMWTVWDKE